MAFIRPYQESDFEACAHIVSRPGSFPYSAPHQRPDNSHCTPDFYPFDPTAQSKVMKKKREVKRKSG